MAIDNAMQEVGRSGNLPVPLHLRNAPTKLMKDLGYHEGYKYSHDFEGHYVAQQYLPDGMQDKKFWFAAMNPHEIKMQEHLNSLKNKKND